MTAQPEIGVKLILHSEGGDCISIIQIAFSMQSKLATGEIDKFDHFQTKKAAWQVERRHMERQIARRREQQQVHEHAKKAAAASRAKMLAETRRAQDELEKERTKVQAAVHVTEQNNRDGGDHLRSTWRTKKAEGASLQLEASHALAEEMAHARELERIRIGTERWQRGIQSGVEDVEFERAESEKYRCHARRECLWHGSDKLRDDRLRSLKSRQLPTGPGILEHQQVPGSWRAELLSMSCGCWESTPRHGTIERAHSAHTKSHRVQVSDRRRRQRDVATMLVGREAAHAHAAGTTFEAWKLKVGTKHLAGSTSLLSSSTRRMGCPVKDMSPVAVPTHR